MHSCHHKSIVLTNYFTDQQPIGSMDGEAAGERVVDGKSIHVCWILVAPPLVHVPTHVKVKWVAAHYCLLAHVLQLHVRQMH